MLDTLLLLALPASGKSELRRYLDHLSPEIRRDQCHLGELAQLDDFPYVHFMRMVDENLRALGEPMRFYMGENTGFLEPRDWGTLLRLVNDDYAVLAAEAPTPQANPMQIFARIDKARSLVGAPIAFENMTSDLRNELATRLQGEAERLTSELFGARPQSLDGRTLIIEFARGGSEGASMPLHPPHGYAYALAQLSPEILKNAGVLYIWVDPEESRRKNLARANPDDPGSILHHSAPDSVMRNDYGCDDMAYLIETSSQTDTIQITREEGVFHLPVARFDNRVDRTSFIRDDPDTWSASDVDSLHSDLMGAFARLQDAYDVTHKG